MQKKLAKLSEKTLREMAKGLETGLQDRTISRVEVDQLDMILDHLSRFDLLRRRMSGNATRLLLKDPEKLRPSMDAD